MHRFSHGTMPLRNIFKVRLLPSVPDSSTQPRPLSPPHPRPTHMALTPPTQALPSALPSPILALLPFRTAPTTGASLRGWPITSTTLSTRPLVSGFGDPAPPASHHPPLGSPHGSPFSASFLAYGAQQVKLALAIFVVSRLDGRWGGESLGSSGF